METPTASLSRLEPGRALCAFNVENFDSLYPAVVAAARTGAPVILAVTVPAAEYLGFGTWVALARLLADDHGAVVSLHLDHVEQEDHAKQAADAGFTGVNLLNEGHLTDQDYARAAGNLAATYGKEVSFEFILGTLGHSEHPDATGPRPAAERIVAFFEELRPDILGFDCGSLHGMRERSRSLDLDLIAQVHQRTGAPLVLHGSSGVRREEIRAGIDRGIRKVNIETALRSDYMAAVTTALAAGGSGSRKPRALSAAVHEAMTATYTDHLRHITLGED